MNGTGCDRLISMEMTCNRCHQTVEAENCYCPVCGLPQLVYSAEATEGQGQPERWNEAVRDASSIDWKPALKCALILAIPSGMLCAVLIQIGFSGLLLMAVTGAWTVSLYMRRQRPAWITIGAGARLGLVAGVLGSWMAAATTGLALYAARYWFRSGMVIDDFWNTLVEQQMVQQWSSMGASAQEMATYKAWLLSAEGRGGVMLFILSFMIFSILVFSVAGGALGARFLARSRRPEI